MSAVTTLPFSGPFTRADLEAMPDDGHRYELIDGILVVSPSPVWMHQRAAGRVFLLLENARPSDDFEVLPAPFDVALTDDTVMIPDVLVARYGDLTEKDLPTAPLLAIEVLSPSTRRFDLMLKHSRLEAAGCASYWVVDPNVPSLIAWELRDGAYVEVANVTGDEVFHGRLPYPVDVAPTELVAR